MASLDLTPTLKVHSLHTGKTPSPMPLLMHGLCVSLSCPANLLLCFSKCHMPLPSLLMVNSVVLLAKGRICKQRYSCLPPYLQFLERPGMFSLSDSGHSLDLEHLSFLPCAVSFLAQSPPPPGSPPRPLHPGSVRVSQGELFHHPMLHTHLSILIL